MKVCFNRTYWNNIDMDQYSWSFPVTNGCWSNPAETAVTHWQLQSLGSSAYCNNHNIYLVNQASSPSALGQMQPASIQTGVQAKVHSSRLRRRSWEKQHMELCYGIYSTPWADCWLSGAWDWEPSGACTHTCTCTSKSVSSNRASCIFFSSSIWRSLFFSVSSSGFSCWMVNANNWQTNMTQACK